MNLENVVLVRVMSHLPLNGELIPSCEGERLEFEKTSDFQSYIQKLVEKELEKELGRPLNLYFESPDALLRDKIMEEYKVLKGAYYTSTLSFSLNGIVPDDNTCEFSKQPLAVIDPLKNHPEAKFINIEAIDTTSVGKMKVSPEAILVINREIFNSLSDEVKANLTNNFKKIELFDGILKDAVDATLKKYNYPSLPLKQKKDADNMDDCPEKDSMIEFMDKFAESINASRLTQQKIRNLVSFYNEGDKIANEILIGDFYKNLKVEEYYKHQLYNFLIAKAESLGIEVTDEEKWYLLEYSNAEKAMERITKELINAYGGLKNFKAFIKEYNEYALANYLTNAQIVALEGDTRK